MRYQLIFVIVGVILIIVGFLRSIDWYSFFSRWYGNNPTKCKVYIHFGRNVEYIDGEYSYVDDKYIFYVYRYKKQDMAVAIRQADMDNFGYIRGRVMIHTKFGEGVTVLKDIDTGNLITMGETELPARAPGVATIGAVELDASIQSKTAVALVNTVSSRGGMKIMTIILVCVVIVAAFMWYKSNQDKKAAEQKPVPAQQQTNPNAGVEDLLKEGK